MHVYCFHCYFLFSQTEFAQFFGGIMKKVKKDLADDKRTATLEGEVEDDDEDDEDDDEDVDGGEGDELQVGQGNELFLMDVVSPIYFYGCGFAICMF